MHMSKHAMTEGLTKYVDLHGEIRIDTRQVKCCYIFTSTYLVSVVFTNSEWHKVRYLLITGR